MWCGVCRGRMLRVIDLWSFSFGFLLLCSANGVPCTVTQDAGQTRYTVSDFKATNCHYWWNNSTNHALANHDSKSKMVVMQNLSTLLIDGCREHINYMRDCISEGIPREANCITKCSGHAVPQSGGESLTSCVPPKAEIQATGISRNHWIAVAVVIILLLLLLLLVGLFLYSFKNHICSCRKLRCLHTDGKVQNNPPNVADEEAQLV